MSVKIESEKQDCCICSAVLNDFDTVIVNEDILVLLRFLIVQIDVNALQNRLICATCVFKINEACQFKSLHEEKQNSSNREMIGTGCDEKFVVCYVCKNNCKLNSSMPLFDYDDIISYFVSKQELENVDDPQVCDTCHICLLNLHSIMYLLSRYDRNNGNGDSIKSELLTNENKIEMIDNFTTENVKPNLISVTIKEELKQETEGAEEDRLVQNLQIKYEEKSYSAGMPEYEESGFGPLNEIVQVFNITDANEQNNKVGENSDDIQLVKCQFCDYQTYRSCYLEKHVSVHHTFRCQFCDFGSFGRKHASELRKHMRVHEGINSETKLFSCEHCEYKSIYKGRFKLHMKAHEKVEPFKCYNCNFETRYKESLKNHLRVHHNYTETFKCDSCRFQTVHKGSYNRHMMQNHNDDIVLLKCDKCPFQTKYKYSLEKHNRIYGGLCSEKQLFLFQQKSHPRKQNI